MQSSNRILTSSRRALSSCPRAVRSSLVKNNNNIHSKHSLGLVFQSAGHKLSGPTRFDYRQQCRSFSSSFQEPNPSLFNFAQNGDSIENTTSTSGDSSNSDHPLLRNDVRVMGNLLGQVVRDHEGKEIFDKVEALRVMAKEWRKAGAGRDGDKKADAEAAFAELASTVASLSDKELFTISRAFTHFLAMANAAEAHHRIRRIRQQQREALEAGTSSGALYPKSDSIGGVLPALLEQGHSAEEIWQALSTQTVDYVLTAHPTEVNRRTIINKNKRVQEILTMADNYRTTFATPYEQESLNRAMYAEMASIWLSDELNRAKPTPEVEAEKGTLVVETVLWDSVPQFLRKLDATAQEFLGKGLPAESAPVRFASWMGGDRDGNPNVKPHTTRIVCLKNRAKAASLFKRDLMRLESELSLTTCSEEMRSLVGDDAREPYRVYLRAMIEKMNLTQQWAEQELAKIYDKQNGTSNKPLEKAISTNDIYLSRQELMDQFQTIKRSLNETGNSFVADGILTDLMRNLSAFGLTLIPLDVRQESGKHEEAIDSITRYLGLGSYSQWDEQTKVNWLAQQISSRRPLIRPGAWRDHEEYFSPTAIDTLEIFQMIAEQHQDSLGAYVISQCTGASDVLAVLLLQLDAGVKKPLRIAPLFETLSDLEGATDSMRTLFSLPAYMGIIGGKQEVMIGYSDSAKDAGRLAASWAQYETQEKLAALAKEFSVDLSFFHGKGGTVGRGGNPQTFLAIMSHAPGTIKGKFRITEQGEMINQNFGFSDRAERTMDIYTAAVLAEKLTERPAPLDDYREMMKTLSDVSCAKYRQVVREDERFVPYFRSATPELELGSLNIGSRPAKRKATGGVESLRAIPWNFAWTQTRLNLPSWLGVGTAIRKILDSDKASVLREMYQNWGSFRTMIDMVEMVLVKSEPGIAKHYDDVLVKDEKAKELGSEVRQAHLETEQAVLDLTNHSELAENNKILLRKLTVRNPYVDCLNVLQAETLRRLRERGTEDKILKDALLISITGVANGMGNTG
ncbi:hypothetical protein ACA910_016109 [Epithemia clementina (nom. ined.)]